MIRQQIIFRIAAAALILIAIASGVFYMTGKGLWTEKPSSPLRIIKRTFR